MPRPLLLLAAPLLVLLLAPSAQSSDSARDTPPELPPRKPLSVKACGPLKVPLPSQTLKPQAFRHHGRRGWVVRLPNPRAPQATTGNERLATIPSPAVWKGRVFAGVGLDGRALHGFDARTGKHASTTKFEDNGPTSPTITPGKVICNTESCTTYAITPRSGETTWSRWVGPTVMGAPAAASGVVYTGHRNKANEYELTAMRLSNGEVLWSRALTRDLYGKPIVANNRIYVSCRDGVVCCFERNGTAVWFSRPGAISAPWVTPDGVYIAEGSAYRKGAPALRRLDPRTGLTVWRTDVSLVEKDSRAKVERIDRPNNVVRLMSRYGSDGPRPVVIGSRCFLAGGRDLISFNTSDGKVRWIKQLPEGHRFHAPPAVLGTHLVYATLQGLVLEVESRSGTLVQGVHLRHLVSSQPVVADGRLHVMAGTLLYGIPWGEKNGPAYPQWGGLETRVKSPVTTGD